MADTVGQDMIDSAGVLMVSEEKEIVKDLPTDFEWKHNFAGWEETKSAKKHRTLSRLMEKTLKVNRCKIIIFEVYGNSKHLHSNKRYTQYELKRPSRQ